MSLAPGTRLGVFQLIDLIGRGGMGEVFRARDTRLDRDVAIKILPEAFAHDADRLARFQREAKTLASLNHPNIAAIYGLEENEGITALVMELVEGEDLSERIARGAIPLDEALPIAKQIAEALEAAHEQGIIHRDLKPANIKVRPDGTVKVLDFGLAKAMEPTGAMSPSMSMSPTITTPAMTQAGMILGTAAYMSPEQARGKTVDKRADIWAFGCVLYEMLSGRRAFEGEDVTDVMVAVLSKQPDWSALPAGVSPSIRRLLRRCVQRDRTLRLQAVGDARIDIQETLAEPVIAAVAPGTASDARAPRRRSSGLSTLIALLGGAALAGIAAWNLKPAPLPAPLPVARFVITLPLGDELADPGRGPVVALSPDGKYLTYVASRGDTQQVYLRQLDSVEAKPIAGSEGARSLFLSPDGRWIGFDGGGTLKKVAITGGLVSDSASAPNNSGTAWSDQGVIAFQPTQNAALFQVSDAGGAPQPLTRLEKGETSHRWPQFLPGGKAVLFASSLTGAGQIAVQVLQTGERRNLVGGTYPRYVSSGHLVYAQTGTLMAVPFDPRTLEVGGQPQVVVEGILQGAASGVAQYAVSNTGSLAYVSGGVQSRQLRLVWVSRTGVEQPINAPAGGYVLPRLSPDGRRVAIDSGTSDRQVWLYDLIRDTLSRVTREGNFNGDPIWTPDGKRLTFRTSSVGRESLSWQAADGSGDLEPLTTGRYELNPASFSPDGQLLAYYEITPTTGRDIWVLHLTDRKSQPFLRTPADESAPKFSPDGHWLAYTSDESGRREIYVQPYPGPGGKWQISTTGGSESVWNPNGRELFYRVGNKMMAVDITTSPSFSAGKPKVLFEANHPSGVLNASYDVSSDGQRFLMLKESAATDAGTQINVVLNWTEELKRLVPTK